MNLMIIFVHSSGDSRSDFCSSHLAETGSSQALHMQLKYHCLDLGDYGALRLQQPLREDIKLYAGVSVTLTYRSTVTLGFLTRQRD